MKPQDVYKDVQSERLSSAHQEYQVQSQPTKAEKRRSTEQKERTHHHDYIQIRSELTLHVRV